MSFDVDLKLVIRSGYASAVAALNHATATVTDRTAAAEFISQHLAHTLQAQGLAHSLTRQELTHQVYALLLGASATLDEQNIWGVSNLSEFSWDYLLFEEALVSSVEALLVDGYALVDLNTSDQTTGLSDQFLASDIHTTDLSLSANDGGERTYFAGDYTLGEYNAAQNSTEEVRAADVQASASDASVLTEQHTSLVSSPMDDTPHTLDGTVVGVMSTRGDVCDVLEASSSLQVASRGDISVAADLANVSVAIALAEGTARTYFADDYASTDYNAPYNSHGDLWALVFGASLADAQLTGTEHYALVEVFAADGETRTYFAADYATSDYNLPEGAVSATHVTDVASGVYADTSTNADISAASWAFPSWVDAATPVDTIALALSVAASDASAHVDSTSTVIQNYAFNPAYFSGDYATTAY